MKANRSIKNAGFTIVELLIAITVGIILMLGALYSTVETYAVVRQGDARVSTQVHARRTLERLIKDCRYASALEITGSDSTSWTITMTTGLDGNHWIWIWDAQENAITVSDGVSEEVVIEGLTAFVISTSTNSESQISKVTMNWTLEEASGNIAGAGQSNPPIDLATSTWIRKFAD